MTDAGFGRMADPHRVGLTRVRWLGLAAAGCVWPSRALAAAKPRRIDVHHHVFPPALKLAAARFGRPDV